MREKYLRTLQHIKGKYISYRQDEVLLSNGNKATRDIVLHPGAVAIVAITPDKELILVRQYRYAVGEELLEIPAGKLEADEDPLLAAQRELSEETGYQADHWQLLTEYYSAVGFCNEKLYLYLASGLKESEAHPDEDEIIRCEKIPFASAMLKMQQGEVKDSKSLIGLLLAFRDYLS